MPSYLWFSASLLGGRSRCESLNLDLDGLFNLTLRVRLGSPISKVRLADSKCPLWALTHACATELCFWLFVLNAGPTQKDWFNSMYFKTWVAGSVTAILYMPLVAIFTRADPLKVRRHSVNLS